MSAPAWIETTMYILHFYPGNASMTPHLLLEECGAPFELRLVDRTQGAHQSPEYLQLNPNGRIPVLVDGDLVLYETAAIVLHLIDNGVAAAFAPPAGKPERAHFFKWLVWLTNTMQATLMLYFYPERHLGAGNATGAAELRENSQARVGDCLRQLDELLASHGGPWLLGADYTAVDIFAFMTCRWTRGFAGAAATPARTWPHLGPWLDRMLDRPAVQRVLAREGITPPYV